jgi:hypothetical protein
LQDAKFNRVYRNPGVSRGTTRYSGGCPAPGEQAFAEGRPEPADQLRDETNSALDDDDLDDLQ